MAETIQTYDTLSVGDSDTDLGQTSVSFGGSERLRMLARTRYPIDDDQEPKTIAAGQNPSGPPKELFGQRSLAALLPKLQRALPEPQRILGMRKWEGKVFQIEEEFFTAELVPLDHSGPTLLADFDLDQLSPDDTVLQPGDVVYLTVRTVGEKTGYRTTTSALRLRRLGRWSEEEVQSVQAGARKRMESLQQYVD